MIQSTRRPKKRIEIEEDEVKVLYSDDAEASWMNKGQQSIYDYSASVSINDEGWVESVTTFSASRSEMTRLDEVVKDTNLSKGQVFLYDNRVDFASNRVLLEQSGLKDWIMRKKPKGKPMTHWNRLRNQLIERRRFVVERTFGTMKRT